jgi:hypothetical protein
MVKSDLRFGIFVDNFEIFIYCLGESWCLGDLVANKMPPGRKDTKLHKEYKE